MQESARLASTADHDEILRLARDARAEALTKRGGPLLVGLDLAPIEALLEPTAAESTTTAVVGTIDRVIVGYALAHLETLHDGERLAVVNELYVDPDARAIGVGELMMDELIAWATVVGCAGIDAHALPGDRQTKNFFETFGLVARQIVVHRRLDPPVPPAAAREVTAEADS